jgi:hypothetical protein
MIGGIEETSASFEARSAPRSYPTPIREGHYGTVQLDGLNLLALSAFEGNLWMEDVKARMGFFIDERADAQQRESAADDFHGTGRRMAGGVR